MPIIPSLGCEFCHANMYFICLFLCSVLLIDLQVFFLFQEPFMLLVCLLTLLIALFLFFCLVKVFDLMLPGLSFLFSFMASEFYFIFIYLSILATWHLVL